jgi:hypothetical protein
MVASVGCIAEQGSKPMELDRKNTGPFQLELRVNSCEQQLAHDLEGSAAPEALILEVEPVHNPMASTQLVTSLGEDFYTLPWKLNLRPTKVSLPVQDTGPLPSAREFFGDQYVSSPTSAIGKLAYSGEIRDLRVKAEIAADVWVPRDFLQAFAWACERGGGRVNRIVLKLVGLPIISESFMSQKLEWNHSKHENVIVSQIALSKSIDVSNLSGIEMNKKNQDGNEPDLLAQIARNVASLHQQIHTAFRIM